MNVWEIDWTTVSMVIGLLIAMNLRLFICAIRPTLTVMSYRRGRNFAAAKSAHTIKRPMAM